MEKEFIAELHDIGKLLDKNSPELKRYNLTGHTFEKFDFGKFGIEKPTSPSWWGQYHHHNKSKINDEDLNTGDSWRDIPQEYRPALFLLILADHLASSISRVLPPIPSGSSNKDESKDKPKDEPKEVLKLWNRDFYKKNKGKYWAAFKSEEDLKKLFEIIDTITSPEEFLSQYNEYLILTPEDEAKPKNITSLYTHIELVGKIYRVLKRHCEIKIESVLELKLNGEAVKTIKEAEGGNRTEGNQNIKKGKWQARFVKCYIKYPHSFVRLQDINLLVKRNKLAEDFFAEYKDYVMFHTSDFISLFLPIGMELKEMFKDFLNNGFFIEYIETIADLGILRSNLDIKVIRERENNKSDITKVFNSRNTRVYRKILLPEMLDKIVPPICDICQINPGKERMKENIKEWICDKCYEVRESGESFKYPDQWQENKIVWFKFNLNTEKLENWLQKAFEKYVDSLNINNAQTIKDEFRSLACQSDFVKDYKGMIKTFWHKASDLAKKPISNYDELGVFLYSGENVKKTIEAFLEVYNEYFPDCEGDYLSPISLSLSISNVKYPIREHFRFFESPEGFINIRNQNIFHSSYDKKEIKWLINNLQSKGLHFLYKLASIYEKTGSEISVIVEIMDKRKSQQDISDLYSKIKIPPEKILNFYRITEVENELYKT
uniref:CRISPR-associated protein Csx11 n=1 Tax=candidate division WOR-3 bacterium TaxID=2052148 RepID=A0A7C3N6H0_UNCW3